MARKKAVSAQQTAPRNISSSRAPSASDHSFVDGRKLQAPKPVLDQILSDAVSEKGFFQKKPSAATSLSSSSSSQSGRITRWPVRQRLMITAVVTLISFILLWFFFCSPFCTVNSSHITIEGANTWVSASDASQKIADDVKGKSLFLIRPNEVAQHVDTIPAVESTKIIKQFPQTLIVKITPRTPQALFKNQYGVYTVVSKNGTIIGTTKQVLSGVPVIQITASELKNADVQQVLDVVSQIAPSIHQKLAAVTDFNKDSVTTTTTDGYTIVWGNATQMDLKNAIVERLIGAQGGIEGNKTINVQSPYRPTISNNGGKDENENETSDKPKISFNKLMDQ
ncbi:MAG: FtsQ-type POTRA domain-containing protein [Aeriscardovia sp.]|nr:FtsQ-type POTRA domain-containing protein [Aeriscardovia sp.]